MLDEYTLVNKPEPNEVSLNTHLSLLTVCSYHWSEIQCRSTLCFLSARVVVFSHLLCKQPMFWPASASYVLCLGLLEKKSSRWGVSHMIDLPAIIPPLCEVMWIKMMGSQYTVTLYCGDVKVPEGISAMPSTFNQHEADRKLKNNFFSIYLALIVHWQFSIQFIFVF